MYLNPWLLTGSTISCGLQIPCQLVVGFAIIQDFFFLFNAISILSLVLDLSPLLKKIQVPPLQRA